MNETAAVRPSVDNLPAQAISEEVLLEKYAKGDERSVDDVRRRVARALAQVEAPRPARALGSALPTRRMRRGFIPAGRINSAAGTDLQATLINCFVQPVGDSISEIVDGKPGIYTALHRGRRDHAPRRRRRLRLLVASARRAPGCSGTHSRASGPVSLHARVRPLLRDGGVGRRAPRRADGRAALRPSRHRGLHPRQGPGRPRRNFNISVGVTDAFMRGGARPTARSNWCTAPSPARRRRPPAPTSATTARGSTARCTRASCGTRSCARPTTTPSRACCSSTASTATTTSTTARRIEATNPCVTADTWVMTARVRAKCAIWSASHSTPSSTASAYRDRVAGLLRDRHQAGPAPATREGHALRLTADHPVRRVTRRRATSLRDRMEQARANCSAGDELRAPRPSCLRGWEGARRGGRGLPARPADRRRHVEGRQGGAVGLGAASCAWWATADGRADAHRRAAASCRRPRGCGATLPHRATSAAGSARSRARGECRWHRRAARPGARARHGAGRQDDHAGDRSVRRRTSAAGLLRGLFDADGSVQGTQDKGVSVRLTQSDLSAAAGCAAHAAAAGHRLARSIANAQAGGSKAMPDGRGGQREYPTQAAARTGDQRRQPRAFRRSHRLCGHATKRQRLTRCWTATGAAQSRALRRHRRIASKPTARSRCTTCTSTDVHAFDANGLFVAQLRRAAACRPTAAAASARST